MEQLTINKIHNAQIFASQKSAIKCQMSTVKCSPRGYTALELLIVIAIIGVLMAVVVPSFMTFRRNSLLNTDTMNLVTLINRARLSSVSSKNDNQYGIHLEAGKAVLFAGPTYSAGASTNETHTFDAALTLSSIVVNGGGSDVLFEKVTGATSQNATTTLLVTGTTSSTTVLVYPTGVATIK